MIFTSYCHCGCGQKVAVSDRNDRTGTKGKPRKYISGHNIVRFGSNHHQYNGGISFSEKLNRWRVRCRDGSYVMYYRVLAECYIIGRSLQEDEVVHHKNGDSSDDRIENLEVMSRLEHIRLHQLVGRDRVSSMIRDFYKRTNRLPTARECRSFNGLPSRNAILSYFSSMEEALSYAFNDVSDRHCDQLKNPS